ncbi:translation initiation factor IF-2 [Angelakisella massiliensis]|uniref:translation initiation factor IF-2 n=1 Tax=Angelakisella massiliensis TaxID=1871018 RepID=UPI003C6C50C4
MEKYRVSEVARDLGAATKDVISMLEKRFPGEAKKSMTVLSKEELDYVFEHYTQNKASSDLDSYFKMKHPVASKAPEAPKAAEAPKAPKAAEAPKAPEAPNAAEAPKVPEAPKAVEAPKAPEAPKAVETPKAPEAPKAAEAPKAPEASKTVEAPKAPEAPKAAETPKAPEQAKPAQNQGEAPRSNGFSGERRNNGQDGQRPFDRNNGQGGQRTFDRNNGQGGQRPFDRNNGQGGQRSFDRNNGQGGQRTFDRNSGQGGQRTFDRNNGQGGQRTFDRNNGQGGQRSFDRNNGQGGQRTFDRNNGQGGQRPFDRNNGQGGQRPFGGPRGAQQTPPKPMPAPPIFDDSKPVEIKMQQPKKKAPKAERPVHTTSAPSAPVVVDMRSSEVNLDKYNERYENIAPATAPRDNGVKKQKLNQRSAKKGKAFMSRKEREEEKMRRLEMERQRRQRLEVTLPEEISVGDLAALLKVQASEIIKRLMPLGVMASISDIIDYDTAALVAMEIGAKVSKEVVVTIEDRLFEQEDTESDTTPRPPVVVVMGHVDHGKTSLLDAIRNAHVVEGEAGGITQHIGAYQVQINGRPITFLDTPGHAAFTAMRARGAQATDIAVLVVAADDGIMPQTIEAINHAKAANVDIIVAINKMDKPHANPDKVKQQLTEHGLVPEEWGGDVICVPVSAKARTGIDNLLETIQLVADLKELKANPNRMAKGTVIEAKLDKGRGPVATVLVQNGTLHEGDVLIAGTAVGRVRVMINDKGQRVSEALPSTPVEITGLAEVPSAGDTFNAVEDERLARELVEKRRMEAKEEMFKSYQKVTLDNLFDQISEGEMKELPIIVKADVQGSVEAVTQSLEKLSNDEVRVRVIHGAVGAVSESDVMLAEASGAIIVGFNVRPDPIAKENAERVGVDIRLYRIIYDAIEEMESAMKGMLAPKFKDVDLGRAEVRQVYNITGVGKVAGCYVLEGKISRGASIRLVRDGIIMCDVKLSSLKRFKDDVKEVAAGYECGMTLERTTDLKVGDIFEAYEKQEIKE